MRARQTLIRLVAGLSLVAVTAGCTAAVAAGAGAGAAIAYNERGAESKVAGTVNQVFARAQGVFRDMNITETAQDNGSDQERELKGRRGDLEITVDIQRESEGMVSVNVYAQRSTVDWDREYAREILQRIVTAR